MLPDANRQPSSEAAQVSNSGQKEDTNFILKAWLTPNHPSNIEDLSCHLCGNIPLDAVYCSVCLKCFCANCQNGSHNITLQCPCATDLTLRKKSPLLDKFLASLEFYCCNKLNNCPEKISYGNWNRHIKHCNFRMIDCPNANCPEQIVASTIDEHNKHCPFKPTACEFCRQMFPFYELKSHRLYCEEKNPICKFCNYEVPADRFIEHEFICSMRKNQCNACEFEYRLDQKNEHTHIDCARILLKEFNEFAFAKLSELKQQVEYVHIRLAENELLLTRTCRYCKEKLCEASQNFCTDCRKILCQKCVHENDLEQTTCNELVCIECREGHRKRCRIMNL